MTETITFTGEGESAPLDVVVGSVVHFAEASITGNPSEDGALKEKERRSERRFLGRGRGAILAAGTTALVVGLSGCAGGGGGGGDAELGCQEGPKTLSADNASHITARIKKGESYYDLPSDHTFDFGTFKASTGDKPKPLKNGKVFTKDDRYINSGPYGNGGKEAKFRLRVRLEGSDRLGSARVGLKCKVVPDKKS